MSKLTINSVHTKEQVYPMLLSFQNGYPNEDFKFECVLIQDEEGKRVAVAEFDNLIFAGEEEKDLGQTFILARNRKTGKVRLIEAGCAELKPVNKYTMQHLEKNKLERDRPKHSKEPELNQTSISQPEEPSEIEPNHFPKDPSEASEVPDRPDHTLSLETTDLEANTFSNCLELIKTSGSIQDTQKCPLSKENEDSLLHMAENSNRPNHVTQSEENLEPIRKVKPLDVKREMNQTELDCNTLTEYTQRPVINDLNTNAHVEKENQSLEYRNKTNDSQELMNNLECNDTNLTQAQISDLNPENESEQDDIDTLLNPSEKPAVKNYLHLQNKLNLNKLTQDSEPTREPNKLVPHQTEPESDKSVSNNTNDTVNTIEQISGNVTPELNTSKYDHIMNYYYDELFATDDNLRRKNEEHTKQREIKNKDFSTVKEMFVEALGLKTNISVNNRRNIHGSIKRSDKETKYDIETQNTFGATYDILSFKNKDYVCRYCNNQFEDKGSLIFHLMSHKFIRNTKNAVLIPLVKRLKRIEIIASVNKKERKNYSHQKKANENNNLQLSQNSDVIQVRSKSCLRISENNVTMIQDDEHVGNLATSEDKVNKQNSYKETNVKEDSENSKDDSPIQIQKENNVVNLSQANLERNYICEYCEKAFEEKGSLIFHLTAHNYMHTPRLIELNIASPTDKIEQNHEKTESYEKVCSILSKIIKNLEDDIIKTKHGEATPSIHESPKKPDVVGTSKETLNNTSHIAEETIVHGPPKNTEVGGLVTLNHRSPKHPAEDNLLISNKIKDNRKKVETLCDIPINKGGSDNDKIKTREQKIFEESDMNRKESQSTKVSKPETVSKQEPKDTETMCVHNSTASCDNGEDEKNKTESIDEKRDAINRNGAKAQMKDDENEKGVSIKEDTIGNMFICNDCGRSFKSKSLLIIHIKNHSKESSNNYKKGIILKYPPINSTEKWQSLNHKVKRKESNDYKICGHCNYKTSYATKIIKHMQEHSKRLKCDHCDKDFRNMYNLKRHTRIHIGARPYSCEICKTKFTQINTLNRHLKTHAETRPFKCTMCPSKFKLESGLKRHLNIHTKEKNYKCETCSSTFRDVSAFKRHMTSHNVKPYTCDICEYSTAHNHELKKHIDTHAKRLFKFKCTSCDFITERGWSLKLHMTRHTGQKAYSCDLCDYSTARSSDFKRHQNKHK